MTTSSVTGRAPGPQGLRAADERTLLERWHRDGDRAARAELVEQMLPFVRHIARGYVGRGEPFDDLVQVGCVGLVKAIDRFDLDRGLRLSTFAAPNISGEIKRHFRDHGWSIRPPRDLQELYVKVSAMTNQLSLTIGRAPTVAELSVALDATQEAVLDAIQAGRNYTASSLDAPVEEGSLSPLGALGGDDHGYALAEARATLDEGLRALPARDRRIVLLRFAGGLTQREIAEAVGVSQMHVSRLLRRSIETLRDRLTV